MPKFKISRATQKGKSWQAKGEVDGRKRTLSGGQKGASVRPGTAKAKSFRARHGTPKTAKQYVNDRIWKGTAKVGDTITIPKKFF